MPWSNQSDSSSLDRMTGIRSWMELSSSLAPVGDDGAGHAPGLGHIKHAQLVGYGPSDAGF